MERSFRISSVKNLSSIDGRAFRFLFFLSRGKRCCLTREIVFASNMSINYFSVCKQNS